MNENEWKRGDLQELNLELARREIRILNASFEHVITPLAILDKSFNYVRVNSAFAQICSRSMAEHIGHNHFEFYPNAEDAAIFLKVVITKTPYRAFARASLHFNRAEKGTIYWDWSVTPILDDAGEVSHLVISLNDVTEREKARDELNKVCDELEYRVEQRTKELSDLTEELSGEIAERRRVEEILRKNEEDLKLALEAADMAIWDWNIRTGELTWSDHCKELFGLEPGTAVDYQMFLDAIHPEDIGRVDEAVFVALKNREDYDVEMRTRWADGSEHWIRSKGRGYYDEEGVPVRMVGMDWEVTNRKRAEEELIRSKSRLEDANRELEAFSYSVSHDLRGPLKVMDDYTQQVLKQYGDLMNEGLRKKIEIVQENVRLMGQLIEDLLAFSRSGLKELSLSLCNMKQIFSETWKQIRKSGARRKIKFVMHELPAVTGDPTLIRQVVYNLLSNAFKFTQKRETALIEVGSVTGETQKTYFVRDNGAGFDMSEYDRLFGVFQRLHRPSEFEGTGIGLPIVKRIVTRHGGKVWAEGEVGRGAVFCFGLPETPGPRTEALRCAVV